MEQNQPKHIAQELIDKDQWAEILSRFIDVLRINIFIVDEKGKTILPPQKGRYGWEILASSPIGFDLLSEHSKFLEKFKKHGFYLEYNYQFDLHSFAIPICAQDENPIAYMIVGPVVLNKRLDKSEYKKIAANLAIEIKNLHDVMNEIRVLSFVGIKSILDLLDEVGRYIVHLKIHQKDLDKKRFKKDVLPSDFRETVKDIYSSIYVDELLITFLEAALKLTKTECGSVMIVDDEKGDLTIRVSRGIDRTIAQQSCIKIGEGIAGLAARERSSFIVHGTKSENNRLQPYLKRSDIKHSLISPIISKDKVLGVLNLSTKDENNDLNELNIETVKTLSQLTSVAINSIRQKSATPSK
ncbi:MAG: GAF domain-containing protein [Candidatus Omnitrophota bacterium]